MNQGTPQKFRVLWVDDNVDILNLYQHLLPDVEFVSVGFLPTPGNLEQEIANCSPDIVALDYSIPGWNPMEAMQRCLSVFPAVRFLVLSVDNAPSMIERALAAGATAFHLKDGDLNALMACLRRVATGISPQK